MPRSESVLTVFLASPSDVSDERNRLEEIVVEWNRAWARNLGLRLELLRWEHDAYPGAGADPQDVINRQIPNDYDLFIGLMWSRFGAATARAGSGTAEEFDRALARFKTSPADVSLFFYFKDTPIPPSEIDPAQLQQVQKFKVSLGKEGLLYWNFADTDQFGKLVTLHLTKHVQSWRHRSHLECVNAPDLQLPTPKITTGVTQLPFGDTADANQDDGYLDLLEVFAERSSEVIEIATRLAEAQRELSARINQGTKELQAHAADYRGTNPTQARRLISKVADEMLRFTGRVNVEVPLFRAAMDGSMSALTRAATLAVEFDKEQVRSAKSGAVQLISGLAGARQSMVELKTSTLGLPRMTKELNVAKRKQSVALDALIGEFINSERLLVEAVTVIDSLLSDTDAKSVVKSPT